MPEQTAQRRNQHLVAHLEETGALTHPAVAAAFRAVLRHQFLPGRSLSETYEDAAILTKVGNEGVALSSSSQPAIMAVMLQQLAPRPGHQVLEIGAGTGYNAALLAYLVGAGGHVVTMDIDEELCAQARANLEAAGVSGVDVVQADGAGGWQPGAPYDRLILTASADDLAPAWVRQLTPGGRLVVPLLLAGPAQLSVAFQKREGFLESLDVALCGFMPLRGHMAVSTGPSSNPEALSRWLSGPVGRTSAMIPIRDLRAGFETWLALRNPDYIRVHPRPDEPAAFGLADDRGAALIAPTGEVDVQVYGDGGRAAARLVDAHMEWARRRPRPQDLRISAFPTNPPSTSPRVPGDSTFRRRWFTFTVSWR